MLGFPLILLLKELHLIMDGLLLVAVQTAHSFNHQLLGFGQPDRPLWIICQPQEVVGAGIQHFCNFPYDFRWKFRLSCHVVVQPRHFYSDILGQFCLSNSSVVNDIVDSVIL